MPGKSTFFTDLHYSVEAEINDNDMQAAHWTVRATHLGTHLGNRPTNRPIEGRVYFLARIAAGRIVENWILFDELRNLQQLRLVTPL